MIAVLGGGVAGLAAARALATSGREVVVLEARDRLGGRVWTDRDFAGVPVELGAEFIHGDGVATWEYIRELGLRTLRWTKRDDSLVRTEAGELLTMAEARAADPQLDLTRSWELPEVPAHLFEDLGSYLERIGFSRRQLRYVERWFANAQGESMRFLSASATLRGLCRMGENGEGDFRVVDGYDALPDHLARDLDVRLGWAVEEIDWSGKGVTLTSAAGERHQAIAAVLSVPVGVLQGGSLRLQPALPEEKARALSGIRMGPVIKLIYRFAQPVVEPQIMAIYSRHNPPMWWSPSYRAPDRDSGARPGAGGPGDAGGQVWTAFVSGSNAASLLALGEEGALAAALESFSAELGRKLLPEAAKLVDWPGDPFSAGGYSYLLPGHDGAREALARPLPPLFFAGEACAAEHQAATVHGAIESGRRAAGEVLEFLEGVR